MEKKDGKNLRVDAKIILKWTSKTVAWRFGSRRGPNEPLGYIKQQNSYQCSCGAVDWAMLCHFIRTSAEGW